MHPPPIRHLEDLEYRFPSERTKTTLGNIPITRGCVVFTAFASTIDLCLDEVGASSCKNFLHFTIFLGKDKMCYTIGHLGFQFVNHCSLDDAIVNAVGTGGDDLRTLSGHIVHDGDLAHFSASVGDDAVHCSSVLWVNNFVVV